MASTIAVLLSENELMIIQSWINDIRENKIDGQLSEAENNLVEKLKDQQRFLKHINS